MCVCFINTLHLCSIETSLSLYTQAQYKFIHNALSELVVCGETEVTASSLKTYTDKLNDHMEDSELTGSQKHFQVIDISSFHSDIAVNPIRYWSVSVNNMIATSLQPGRWTTSAKIDIVTSCPVSMFICLFWDTISDLANVLDGIGYWLVS